LRDSCRELVLIDEDRHLAVSQALDIAQTSTLACGPRVRAGDYHDLGDAEVVVLAAGINEKAGGADKPGDKEGRLRLLDTNAPIFCDVVPKTIAAAPDATLVVATNPLDVMTELTRRPRRPWNGHLPGQPALPNLVSRTLGRGPGMRVGRRRRRARTQLGAVVVRRDDRRGTP
jgi:hypothetical protein